MSWKKFGFFSNDLLQASDRELVFIFFRSSAPWLGFIYSKLSSFPLEKLYMYFVAGFCSAWYAILVCATEHRLYTAYLGFITTLFWFAGRQNIALNLKSLNSFSVLGLHFCLKRQRHKKSATSCKNRRFRPDQWTRTGFSFLHQRARI